MMAMSDGPILLVCDCCDGEPEVSSVLKGLLGVDQLPASRQPCSEIREYTHTLDNKYYTADINVQHLLPCPARPCPSVADSPVEALLVTFDAGKTSSWDDAKKWASFAEERDLDIRLLLCDQVASSSTTTRTTEGDGQERGADVVVLDKETCQTWCIQNGFELVEMRPLDDDSGAESDDEEGFGKELRGVERCVQVLNSHQWTNLILKEQDSRGRHAAAREEASGTSSAAAGAKPVSLQDLEKLHAEKANENRQRDASSSAAAATTSENGLDESALDAAANGAGSMAGCSEDEFGQLFEKFGAMKTQADSLEPSERKAYAEKVVMAFWQAMGGDADEMGDLDGEADSD
eukprot:scpid73878/ scgid7934/ Alpha- and gamma-adaptin-binding protein p34